MAVMDEPIQITELEDTLVLKKPGVVGGAAFSTTIVSHGDAHVDQHTDGHLDAHFDASVGS